MRSCSPCSAGPDPDRCCAAPRQHRRRRCRRPSPTRRPTPSTRRRRLSSSRPRCRSSSRRPGRRSRELPDRRRNRPATRSKDSGPASEPPEPHTCSEEHFAGRKTFAREIVQPDAAGHLKTMTDAAGESGNHRQIVHVRGPVARAEPSAGNTRSQPSGDTRVVPRLLRSPNPAPSTAPNRHPAQSGRGSSPSDRRLDTTIYGELRQPETAALTPTPTVAPRWPAESARLVSSNGSRALGHHASEEWRTLSCPRISQISARVPTRPVSTHLRLTGSPSTETEACLSVMGGGASPVPCSWWVHTAERGTCLAWHAPVDVRATSIVAAAYEPGRNSRSPSRKP